ncbi:MAG: sensor histidine kinase [Candidatus Fimousia sp.]|nr:HAMP domain-containing sensor histidine kinase [Anaerostipes sp.]
MNKRKIIKKHSLRVKMTVCLIVMMIVSILFCWVLNRTMMEDYFVQSERKNISEVYTAINHKFSTEDTVNTLYLERLATNNNLKIIIAQPVRDLTGISLETVYSSTGRDGKLYNNMYSILKQMQEYEMFGENAKSGREIQRKGYMISEHTDTKLDSTSINLLGVLNGGYFIVIASSVESLQTAATIATRFLAYAAVFVTILASIAMFFYSRRFTRPIEEMSEIAQKMTRLDFDARVVNLPEDEIGQLGRSMNQMSEQLEQTISELKTANAQLKKDIDHKIQIDEMRKEFLSHVSHELKTPIALIQGYAEGLVDNVMEDEESRAFYCDVIMDEAKKMNEMVQKLMTLNQIEFGQNQVTMQRFDLTEILKNMIESNRIRFQQKEVKVEFYHTTPVYVWGDVFMIEDVINNYISNAYNHVKNRGKVKIWLEERGKVVRAWVYNDGNRIPEEELSKIWIRFYKVDKARTREYGGSGVGLSIVAAIMDAHGQKYGVKNHENGVAFYFELESR